MQKFDRYKLPLVKDFMTTKVITLTPEQGLEEVITLFNQHRLSAAPVVESEGSRTILGFVTEDDCLRELASITFFENVQVPTVGAAMTRGIQGLSPELDVFQAEMFFRQQGLRHAPVIDQEQRLLGIVARRDLMRALEDMMREAGMLVHKRLSPPRFSMMNEAEWRISTH